MYEPYCANYSNAADIVLNEGSTLQVCDDFNPPVYLPCCKCRSRSRGNRQMAGPVATCASCWRYLRFSSRNLLLLLAALPGLPFAWTLTSIQIIVNRDSRPSFPPANSRRSSSNRCSAYASTPCYSRCVVAVMHSLTRPVSTRFALSNNRTSSRRRKAPIILFWTNCAQAC